MSQRKSDSAGNAHARVRWSIVDDVMKWLQADGFTEQESKNYIALVCDVSPPTVRRWVGHVTVPYRYENLTGLVESWNELAKKHSPRSYRRWVHKDSNGHVHIKMGKGESHDDAKPVVVKLKPPKPAFPEAKEKPKKKAKKHPMPIYSQQTAGRRATVCLDTVEEMEALRAMAKRRGTTLQSIIKEAVINHMNPDFPIRIAPVNDLRQLHRIETTVSAESQAQQAGRIDWRIVGAAAVGVSFGAAAVALAILI